MWEFTSRRNPRLVAWAAMDINGEAHDAGGPRSETFKKFATGEGGEQAQLKPSQGMCH